METGNSNGSMAGEGQHAAALERNAAGWSAGSADSGAGKIELSRLDGLPVQLDVRVPLPDFRVEDLLSLSPGRVLASAWPSSSDLPLTCGDVQLVWTEFEVVDQTLAVRVTRLV